MDRPIIFSGPMVKALLAGMKTQTRRILQPQPYPFKCEGKQYWNASGGPGGRICISDSDLTELHRWRVGDRLWVKERWARTHVPAGGAEWVVYAAVDNRTDYGGPWKSPRFMPKIASRLTLLVTDLRVQRLQDISPEDARDEGVNRWSPKVRQMWLFGASAEKREAIYLRACPWEYRDLWDTLNAKRGFGWDTNPWIVALTFDVVTANIDSLTRAEA